MGAWGFRIYLTCVGSEDGVAPPAPTQPTPARAVEGGPDALDNAPAPAPVAPVPVPLSLRLPLQRNGGRLPKLLRRVSAVMTTTCDGETCSWKPPPRNTFDWNRRFRYMRPHAGDLKGERLIGLVDRFFADDVYGSQKNLGFFFL